MLPLLNSALRAGRCDSVLIFGSIERLDTIKVDEKEAKDYVTELDRAAAQSIIPALRKAYPTHGILGEESGLQKGSGEG
ncbi:inositol monophosphatase family protein, partial [Pseudomonas syringae pv. tagetis]|uniref:inositol monophosphatase family protein n=1 Tax=Pseudomonas syringae group genomosp. 7 TaxID=251699 RepID=UPI0037706C41